ncbi:MFS transporter [Exilibacterium tricleocarpae]|uniref:MFS transporter n=1 Tax=Exilibacterium tricleocarpae TaxID=2591008 RepID=A0A545TLS0_9GAMM|nr:glycoside-pentoside-hexuronide (GPH):cation symporter [Exilibacterium tricleocarpae]TQV78185.1 MFS transporter [Exilibacterium tricleocarpae]
MSAGSRQVRLQWRERLGFGAGDLGFNLYWTTIASFLAAFYTDVFGISAAAAGTMLFTTKIVDAFTDPLMGGIADRTNTRFGKFRPYLLFAGVPMAAAAVLTFTTPDLPAGGKLIWAYVTYTAMMVLYTVLNTPYSALSGVMTASSQERTTLISARFFFAFTGGALVNKFTLPLVEHFGGGDDVLGWQLTMLLYGAIAAIIFCITFATTKERIAPPPMQKTKPLADIGDLLRNRPWLILFVLAMVIMMTITMRAGSAYYYFKYYVERPDLLPNYLFWQMVAYAAGALLAPVMTRFMDKSKLLMLLMGIVGVLSISFYFVPKDMIWAMFTLNILISLALGPKSPLTWSMYADTADYNEWKNGRRATAMTFSAATFSQKLGGSFGSAGMLWVLAAIGYVANEAQSGASQHGIALLQTAVPGAFALLAVIVTRFYSLTGAQLQTIQEELEHRHEETA